MVRRLLQFHVHLYILLLLLLHRLLLLRDGVQHLQTCLHHLLHLKNIIFNKLFKIIMIVKPLKYRLLLSFKICSNNNKPITIWMRVIRIRMKNLTLTHRLIHGIQALSIIRCKPHVSICMFRVIIFIWIFFILLYFLKT